MGLKNIEAIMGCRQRFNLSPLEFTFLWYIAFRGNDEERPHEEFNKARHRGEAWPGYKTIEKDLGIDTKNIDRTVEALINKDLIDRCPDFRGRRSYTYLINFDLIETDLKVSTTQGEGTHSEVHTDLKVRGTSPQDEVHTDLKVSSELELELEGRTRNNLNHPAKSKSNSKPETVGVDMSRSDGNHNRVPSVWCPHMVRRPGYCGQCQANS